MKLNYNVLLGCIIISIGIILNGYIVSNNEIEFFNNHKIDKIDYGNKNVLNIKETAKYLNMTEKEVKGIMDLEKKRLEETGSFSGVSLSYIIVNEKHFFSKKELDRWIEESAMDKRIYDIDGGVLLK